MLFCLKMHANPCQNIQQVCQPDSQEGVGKINSTSVYIFGGFTFSGIGKIHQSSIFFSLYFLTRQIEHLVLTAKHLVVQISLGQRRFLVAHWLSVKRDHRSNQSDCCLYNLCLNFKVFFFFFFFNMASGGFYLSIMVYYSDTI